MIKYQFKLRLCLLFILTLFLAQSCYCQSDSTHNNPPKANPDHVTTTMNNAIIVVQIANDVDPDGNPILIDQHVPKPTNKQ